MVVCDGFCHECYCQKKFDIHLEMDMLLVLSAMSKLFIFASDLFLNGTINGGFQVGAGIEIKPQKMMGIEFLVQPFGITKAPMTYYHGGVKSGTFDASININFMLGVEPLFCF